MGDSPLSSLCPVDNSILIRGGDGGGGRRRRGGVWLVFVVQTPNEKGSAKNAGSSLIFDTFSGLRKNLVEFK